MTGVAAASDRGFVREENQDAWSSDEKLGLVVVSDGMGGRPAGALAAQTVVTQLPELLRSSISVEKPVRRWMEQNLLRELVLAVSGKIIAMTQDKPELKGMGATVVAAWRCGLDVHIAHQGDSRAYLFRNGNLKQLTVDHSVAALLVWSGRLSKKEAETHPLRDQLIRVVGMEGEVYCDVQAFRWENGDKLLLCTDGLWGVVSDWEISGVLACYQDITRACGELISLAKRQGAPDNVTVLIWELNA